MPINKEQSTTAQPADKAEVAVLKTIAARFRETRGLAGPHDYQAANWLGVTPAELTALEDEIQANPLSTIRKVSKIFDVSIDYLFGETDDWELCPEVRRERDFSAHLQGLFVAEQAKVAVKLVEQDNRITALSEAVTVLAPAIRNVYDAILRFWELNPSFEDMPGGAPVINHLDRADKAAHESVCQLIRHGILPFEVLNSHPIREPKKSNGLKVNHG